MKKPSSKIREEIAKLQDQLRHAETREAERIGRIALRAGFGDIEIDETALLAAFEELAGRFRRGDEQAFRKKHSSRDRPSGATSPAVETHADAGGNSEA